MLECGISIEKSRELARSLDWSGEFFNGPSNQTLTCAHCDEAYRDHARSLYRTEKGSFFILSRHGCPHCLGHAVKYARSDLLYPNGRNT